MNTQMLKAQIELDFEELAKEHEAAADNEHLWALGTSYPHIAEMHEENEKQHRLLARMYRNMKADIPTFIGTYEDSE